MKRIFRWYRAALYRKLVLSHIGVLCFLMMTTWIGFRVAYRDHIRRLFQERFDQQTNLLVQKLNAEFAEKGVSVKINRELQVPDWGKLFHTKVTSSFQESLSHYAKGKSNKKSAPSSRPSKGSFQENNIRKLLLQHVPEGSLLAGSFVSLHPKSGGCWMEAMPSSFCAKNRKFCKVDDPKRFKNVRGVYFMKTSCELHQNLSRFYKQSERNSEHGWRAKWRFRRVYTLQFAQGPTMSLVYHWMPPFPHPGAKVVSLLIILFVFVGIVIITVPISRSITKSLQRLNQHVNQIREGKIDKPFTFSGDDEVAQLAKNIENMRERLFRLSEERSALIADLSHEIRTPLARIRTVAECVADGIMREDEKLTQAMEGVCSQVDGVDQLIGDLMDIARFDLPEQRRLERANLSTETLLAEVKRYFEPAMQPKEQSLAYEPTGSLPNIYADERRVRQIFTNLFQNAMRYSPEKSEIRLSARLEKGTAKNFVRFEVCDQGEGVPLEEREKIFERLYRVDPSRSRQTGGQGLGLAIVKQLVEAHDGEVGVAESENGGACFWFTMPVATKKER